MFDIVALTINTGVISYLIFTLLTGGGLNSFGENYIFIGYLIFATLTLPNLISKVILKSKIVSLTSALCFLYFPLQFIITVGISKYSGLSMSEILPFASIFNLILWNILFIFFILSDEKHGDYSEHTLKNIFSALFPAIIFTVFVNIFIRQPNSIVALDYLQHLTVANKIFYDGTICLLPGQCSNLFLQHGYTTFYHIIIGNISVFLQNNPIKVFYVLDIIYPLIASIPLFYIFKKFTQSRMLSQLGVLLTLLVFVMGGYDFVFFIPQTFALLLFLMIFKQGRLNFIQLVLATLLLIPTHFIIGTLLAGYLWFKHIVIYNLHGKKELKIFYLMLLVSLIFFVLANIAGFSVEKLIQADSLKVIGSLTNPYFPNNLNTFVQILGPVWIFILIAMLTRLFEKTRKNFSLSSFTFLVLGSILYFLAPTYANKFTIGIGLFAVIFLLQFISTLKFRYFGKLFLSITLVFIFLANFYIQYRRYLTFYTQSNGTVSAITKQDGEIVEYFKTQKTSNIVVSDPYTQLMIASLTNTDTVQAQYMQLSTRENLLNYLKDPTPKTYEAMITSPGFPSQDTFELLYTSRLQNSLIADDTSWIFNIYSLNINNGGEIQKVDEKLINDMARTGRKPIYIGKNFVLFKK